MFHRCFTLITALLLTITGSTILWGADTLQPPQALQQHWRKLQQEDRLEEWINARLDYVDQNPAQRMDMLMQLPQSAWRSYRTYSERLTWFDMLALQGYYQLQTGNILASIAAYEKALAFYEGYPLPDAQVIEYVLKPLGNNYTRLADYDMALYIHRKTLALAAKQSDKEVSASVFSNMSVCARWQGNFDAASLYCRQAMEQVRAGSALQGLLLSIYADILTEQNAYDSAFVICKQALQLLSRHKGEEQVVRWYIGALQQMVAVALFKKQPQQAAAYIRQATALYQQYFPQSRLREKAKLEVLAGNVCLQTGEAERAGRHFIQALHLMLPNWQAIAWQPPAVEYLYGENTLGDAIEGTAKSLQAQDKEVEALPWFIVSIQAQAVLRQEFFYTTSKLREIAVTRNRAEAAMQLAYHLWDKTKQAVYAKQALQIAELSKAQVLWDEQQGNSSQRTSFAGDSLMQQQRRLQQAVAYYRHEALSGNGDSVTNSLLQQTEYKLALLQKQYRKGQGIEKASLPVVETLLEGLPAGVTGLSFFDGKAGCYLLEFSNTGVHTVTRLSTGTALQDSVLHFMNYWYARGPGSMINNPQEFYRHNLYLYQQVFAGYRWSKGKRYLLIPDGVLNYLPFDAFVTGEGFSHNYSNWPFLLKNAVLSRAYSLQSWNQQQQTIYAKGRVSGFFISAGQQQQYAVLGTEREYATLKAMVKGDYYFDTSATYQQFKAALPATALLQVSTHAGLTPEPLLQLYDAPFYLSDLQYYSFKPSLVVLSACRTADGALMQGEGINSLQRGFVAAGAGGVLGSLWNVNDVTAIELSALFYRHLSAAPDAGMALHQAKSLWIRQHTANAVLQLPYYWAAFEYSGHLQPVAIKGAYSWFAMVCVAAAALVIGAMIFMLFRRKRARG